MTGPCMCDLRGQKRAVPAPRSQVGSLMSGFLRLRGLLTRSHPLGLCDPGQGESWFRRALGEATARVVRAVGGTGQEAAGRDTSQPSPQHGPLCRLCPSVAEGAPCAAPPPASRVTAVTHEQSPTGRWLAHPPGISGHLLSASEESAPAAPWQRHQLYAGGAEGPPCARAWGPVWRLGGPSLGHRESRRRGWGGVGEGPCLVPLPFPTFPTSGSVSPFSWSILEQTPHPTSFCL